MGDNMFDLSSGSDKDIGEDIQNVFNSNFNNTEDNPLDATNFANPYGEENPNNSMYYEQNGYSNQNVADVIDPPPQFMYQNSNLEFPNRLQSFIAQPEPIISEMKMEIIMDQEEPINMEIKQQDDNFELSYDHIAKQEEEEEDEMQKDQAIRSKAEIKPVEEVQYVLHQQEFNNIYYETDSIKNIQCFPPPYFKHFATPKSIAPPSLEVIQKNKQYFSLGSKIDFSSVHQKPQEMISKEDRALVSQILIPGKNFYDVMQEVMSSIMNKCIEILKHSTQGGQQLNEFITDLETLIKKFSILCKLSKIKLAKLEVKHIFEKEKETFQKSVEQIQLTISQIKRFKDSLKINDMLNQRNALI